MGKSENNKLVIEEDMLSNLGNLQGINKHAVFAHPEVKMVEGLMDVMEEGLER